ncbi:alanine racemase [Chitinibacter bivalviorum]|uniref:Alanine racemase n=1 Tax=Chitinibacter bivalviorum TaxID=2739434 RepID=A0A7H9BDI1_9NEIS|nr:alanine racemase [Chitinibacter bivalviorum]QLG86760.1 alanine racemase [Chitinibacter bivalviorum]
MSRPIEAVIHSAALKHNYQLIKRQAPTAKAFAVIKANAYGHGVERVCAALPEADGFAILELDAAIALRTQGITQPILLLEGAFSPLEMQRCAQYQLMFAIHEPRHLQWLADTELERPVDVFLKLNTGMNRLGFPAADVTSLVAQLQAMANVASVTLMTHFATADEPEQGIAKQWGNFQQHCADLNMPATLANSAAIFAYPEVHAQWVRPGIALYGSSPFAHRSAQELDLHAAMTLRSRIIAVQSLQAGDTVGYGASFIADRAMKIGVVACGYADGYPRHAPTGTPILVAGQLSRVLGRVSMDMLCVDLTDIADAQIDAEVELWGQRLSIDLVAQAAGTIAYELMCAIANRVPVRTN